jgi:hypothetical protein
MCFLRSILLGLVAVGMLLFAVGFQESLETHQRSMYGAFGTWLFLAGLGGFILMRLAGK